MYIPLYPTKCPTIVSNPNPHDQIMVGKSHYSQTYLRWEQPSCSVTSWNIYRTICIYIYIDVYTSHITM